MIVYRITSKKHAGDVLGTGAAIYGGRWNKKGTPVLYTSESKALALLEIIVHTPPMLVPNLDLLVLEIPNNSITKLKEEQLPKNWMDYPAPTILSEIAEKWVQKAETIALKVPSCIIHSAHNYILNCRHQAYNKVKLLEHKSFHFNSRLIK